MDKNTVLSRRIINIPTLKTLTIDSTEQGKNVYKFYEVLPFFVENNQLKYFVNNHGKTKNIRCLKKMGDNDYKIFGYKTSGILSHTVHFLLDVNLHTVYFSESGVETLTEWCEYLLQGGNYEKALEHNRSIHGDFNPLEGL